MRTLITLLLFLAIPTFAAAQQADQVDQADTPAPAIQLEQSTPAPSSSPAVADDVAPDADLEMETRDMPTEEPAAMQQPGTSNWWWIVGAVVVGGLIVALLL